METLLADTISLDVLWLLAFATGMVLFLWSILRRGIKAGPVQLPAIVRKWVRFMVLFIALGFMTFGGYGVWNSMLKPPPTLKVFIGVGEEELCVIKEIITEFEKDHGIVVKLENVTSNVVLDRLEEEKVDLITFDVNMSQELVRRGLVEVLSEEEYQGLIPSAVNPVLLEHLEVNGIRYFAPYRPNVQLVFLNKEGFAEAGIEHPKTWWEVKEAAKIFYERDSEARVVIQATSNGIPLTLLQVIRSAGGSPHDLFHPQTKEALEFMRQLYTYVSPKSSRVDWQTTCGFLLSDDVYLARSWCFSIGLIHEAARDADFEIYAGWSWNDDSKPSNLLGGEFLALPKNARHKELAIELMRYLMSKEVQGKLATELGWPPVRLDAMGDLPPWLQSHQKVLNAALSYAEPVPYYWLPEMPGIYRRLFDAIVRLDPGTSIDSTLASFQAEIDVVKRPRRQ